MKDTMKVRQKERGERQKHIADETAERWNIFRALRAMILFESNYARGFSINSEFTF